MRGEFTGVFRQQRAVGGERQLLERPAAEVAAKAFDQRHDALADEGFTPGQAEFPDALADEGSADAVKLFEFISSEVRYIELMFEANVSALCSRKGVESLIAKGGDSAALLKEIRADQPEVVSELVMISPPADPVAYASAWDKVLAS